MAEWSDRLFAAGHPQPRTRARAAIPAVAENSAGCGECTHVGRGRRRSLVRRHRAINRTAEELCFALTEIGFYFIVNHGVPSGQIHAVFRQAAGFHALPLQKKLEVKLDKHNVGYLPMRGDTLRTSGGRARRPG